MGPLKVPGALAPAVAPVLLDRAQGPAGPATLDARRDLDGKAVRGTRIAVPLAIPLDTVDRPVGPWRAGGTGTQQTIDDAEERSVADPQSNTTTPRATSPAIMRLKPSLISPSL